MERDRIMAEGTSGPEIKTAAEIALSDNPVEKSHPEASSDEAKAKAEAILNPVRTTGPIRETLPPIPPERRAELEVEFGRSLSESEIRYIDQVEFEQQAKMRAAHKAQIEAGETERRDPYSGLTDKQLLALPWDEAQSNHQLPEKEGFITIRLRDQMKRQYWVYWPQDEKKAQEKVRDLLGRIELGKANLGEDPDLNDEYQSMLMILGTLERYRKTNHKLELGVNEVGMTVVLENDEIETKIKGESEELIKENRARNAFRGAFLNYEMQSDNKVVISEARKLFDPEYLNTLFAIDEFVDALQYYEDNGFRFAEHNSNEGRLVFAKEAQMHLAHLEAIKLDLVPGSDDYKQFIDTNHEKNAWVQFLAERFFRFTGRASEYDHLVVEEDGKDIDPKTGKLIKIKRAVSWTYSGPLTVSWASGGSGCDYETRKTIRLRDWLRYENKSGRVQIKLLNGADMYAGDFCSKTMARAGSKLDIREDKDNSQSLIVASDQKDLDNLEFLTYKVARTRYFDTDIKEYKWTERFVEADRNTADNTGERVGRINFKKVKETKYTFTTMDDSPFGLWTTRYFEGPDKARQALTADDGFLLNPNFDTLKKTEGIWDFEKGGDSDQTIAELRAHAWKTKETLTENTTSYLKHDRFEATGKENYDDEKITAGLNDLAGLTKDGDRPFIGLTEWIRIMQKELGIKMTKEIAELEGKEFKGPENEMERREKAKELAKKIKGRIQRKLDIRFIGSWFLEFLLGLGKGFLKEIAGPLGGK